jgi:ribonuclease HII
LLPSSLKDLVRDSKTLSTKQRQRVVPAIKEVAIEWAIGQASVGEIEKHNILQATFLAMRRALGLLTQKYDMLLVDGNQQVAGYQGEQMTIISGDDHCYAIAAASIIAKEHRDEYMRQQSKIYPQYGFDHHVGYGTKVHLNSIIEHGICPLHRKTFAPVAKALQLTL